MKNLGIDLILGSMVGCGLIIFGCADGCNAPAPTPASFMSNEISNPITDRQYLVAVFKSTDVYNLPNEDTKYVVRDTNGAVWFVKSGRRGGTDYGKTMIFGPTVSKPVEVEAANETNLAVTNR